MGMLERKAVAWYGFPEMEIGGNSPAGGRNPRLESSELHLSLVSFGFCVVCWTQSTESQHGELYEKSDRFNLAGLSGSDGSPCQEPGKDDAGADAFLHLGLEGRSVPGWPAKAAR